MTPDTTRPATLGQVDRNAGPGTVLELSYIVQNCYVFFCGLNKTPYKIWTETVFEFLYWTLKQSMASMFKIIDVLLPTYLLKYYSKKRWWRNV